MAEIPVTKKSGIPWWVWAILAAIVLLLLFLFLGGDDDDVDVADADRAVVASTDTNVITDLTTLEQGTAELAGRQVDIDGARVERMIGDRGFLVTDNAGATVYVVLDEIVPGPDSGDDGDVDVNTGQTVDIEGEVFEVTNGRINGEPIEGLPQGAQLYVYASTVEIEAR